MIVRPRPGQRVQVWYATKPKSAPKWLAAALGFKRKPGRPASEFMPLHGRFGIVRIVARGGGPRNHGVEIDGEIVAVPCGNLRKAE